MKLSLLSSVTRNGVIGAGNDLVWRDPQDMRHFRETTTGHPVLMGRKTWQSLPDAVRPLPKRRNVVVTRDAAFATPGAECAHSLDEALALLADEDWVYVIGGAELFAALMPRADELLLTEIDIELPGDVYFPPWNRADFDATARRDLQAADGVHFAIVSYRRKLPGAAAATADTEAASPATR